MRDTRAALANLRQSIDAFLERLSVPPLPSDFYWCPSDGVLVPRAFLSSARHKSDVIVVLASGSELVKLTPWRDQ